MLQTTYITQLDTDKIGANLHFYRKTNNLTTKQIAKHLNICPSQYTLFESGAMYPPLPMLDVLSQMYLVPIEVLLYSNPLNLKKEKDLFFVD